MNEFANIDPNYNYCSPSDDTITNELSYHYYRHFETYLKQEQKNQILLCLFIIALCLLFSLSFSFMLLGFSFIAVLLFISLLVSIDLNSQLMDCRSRLQLLKLEQESK